MGFTVDQATANILAALLTSQAPTLDIDSSSTAASTSPLPSLEAVQRCAKILHLLGVVFYCDKNSGLGTICCPLVAWEVYRDKFYLNPDYDRSDSTVAMLTELHRKAFADNGWGSFSRFNEKGDGFNTPFCFPKFKNKAKYRGILSAANHQLKDCHRLICLAIRTTRLFLHAENPNDCRVSNLGSTFEATTRLRCSTDGMICGLNPPDTTPRPLTPLGFAGDVAKMYDVLDALTILLAVDHHLEKVRKKYRGRSKPVVLLHRLDDDAHRIGSVNYNAEAWRIVTFEHITSGCAHYVKNTYFRFAGVTFRLLLGIPQGGSLSVELCFIFCLYCEDQWLASIFDYNLLTPDGVVRRHALLPHTVAAMSSLSTEALPSDPLAPVLALAITRYFDDCRLVVYTYQSSLDPRLNPLGRWIVDSYRNDCYVDPCELEDEAYGTVFSFLQGSYVFTDHGCCCLYMAKNTESFTTLGILRFYSMQHYLSFSQDRERMRLAVLLGKCCEVGAFSHPPLNVGLGVLSILPDLAHLGYPFALVKKAFKIMSRRTGNMIWSAIVPLVGRIMRGLSV
jgi:hypothetical protein